MNTERDTKIVLSEDVIRSVPIRALPVCQCDETILIIARQYDGGEHFWTECGTCYKRGNQAIPKHLIFNTSQTRTYK